MDTSRWSVENALFLLWALTGIAGTVVLAGALTIGIFVLPVALLLAAAAALLTRHRPHRAFVLSGLLLGPAALSSYIGASWAARDSSPDGSRSHLVPLHFLPYAAVTVICFAVAVALFVGLGRRAHHRQQTAH